MSSSKQLSGVTSNPSVAGPTSPRIVPGANFVTPQDTQHGGGGSKGKKKRSKAKRRRNRRQSFAAPSDTTDAAGMRQERPSMMNVPESSAVSSHLYRLSGRGNRSSDSLKSEALLDHRDSNRGIRAHRPSINPPSSFGARFRDIPRQSQGQAQRSYIGGMTAAASLRNNQTLPNGRDSDDFDANDRTPLLGGGPQQSSRTPRPLLGVFGRSYGSGRYDSYHRRSSLASSVSSRRQTLREPSSIPSYDEDYDVNNPPSIPGSPRIGSSDEFDVTLPDFGRSQSPSDTRSGAGHDAIIDIDDNRREGSPSTPGAKRRQPLSADARDVCIPFDQVTEADEEDFSHLNDDEAVHKHHHHRKRRWPDLSVLEEWSLQEKEQQIMEGVRAKKVNEPVLVGGRLRPKKSSWRREEEEAPFRWTYFNEEFDASLRSHTISGLQQLGHSFRELFIPDFPELEDSSSDESDDPDTKGSTILAGPRAATPLPNHSRVGTRQSSVLDAPVPEKDKEKVAFPGELTEQSTLQQAQYPRLEKPKRYGPRPVFWLDVLQPSWEEMSVLSRAFGIHSLTSEDIMEQEAREKVELFRNYYFVNYRTFEHDEASEDYLDPVNMYFIVFKGGVISFHFSQMPHPPLVRRRMRQLAEHQYTDSDWISYAIIDNITDAYAPLIEQIEKDVDEIDDVILRMHRIASDRAMDREKGKSSLIKSKSEAGESTANPMQSDLGRDMLLRVGESRKKVMGLYRLLGNKADVIKGLAKRCNEQWEVAPRSDVGLYLGDIQDHIVTMTANLQHYEKYNIPSFNSGLEQQANSALCSILSRAHSNYLAQLNMSMNESAERNADVLGKLTVLGTIVLPMNVLTGMWGMNVTVPGQDTGTLYWFWSLTAGLVAFGVSCFFIAKKVYGVV